ncbi:hypothetical protein GW17_00036857 [Ensete ventricosum]|nr:hypothetical protein GW17_00036857 [Ensete ventricosum]RZS17724.1 hypothetical protein BHM03_00049911 [Ensete ventricosum]
MLLGSCWSRLPVMFWQWSIALDAILQSLALNSPVHGPNIDVLNSTLERVRKPFVTLLMWSKRDSSGSAKNRPSTVDFSRWRSIEREKRKKKKRKKKKKKEEKKNTYRTHAVLARAQSSPVRRRSRVVVAGGSQVLFLPHEEKDRGDIA